MSNTINLKNGEVKNVFFYKGRQIYIIYMATDKYKGYHFKIINRCNNSAGECYSVPFKYANECEKISIDMIRQGRI